MTAFERVKKLCKDRGISIAKLEEKVGFGKNSLYSWKQNNPSSDKLHKVADYFNVSVDYLLGRTDFQIETIAAHHDGEDWTEEELEEIERFKEFVRLKREKK
ncbi:helix-turn-helix transcriptional regulator [Bacillus atrophaeus]|uniref:helix-turn-helix domain-containing protein n=1 Tax=Bacillus atrophaeus TaxID=1452 RepID=UPI002DBD1F81|nr:helix-turn-helix transcriptional regulator [Bacillus atrophaeus]MEC0886807.1 helix-turn-helix transcriptional regulator [Bacillus atrophaeus]MED4845957.1 helix-turn-helix transcriptional regulator [Bacillus atrophaeus]